jgi:WD40 repeat protein
MSDQTVAGLGQLPEPAGSADAKRLLLQKLMDEQRACWSRGQSLLAEHLLERNASLRTDRESLLDLLYNEILLREEHGQTPQLQEYVERFPELAGPLRDQFEVHQALASRELRGLLKTEADARSDRASGRAPLPPVELPGFEILDELGRGGMGVVYRAFQVRLSRLVALKVLRGGVYADAVERERFRTEAEAAARLQHPSIIQIYEVGEHAGQPYVALEYVDGGSLAQKLAGAPLLPRQAAALLETLARAMHYAHQRGVVHRDLTPNNVLLTTEGHPKIADFGLAKLVVGGAEQTQSGAILGTPSYMAPEQAGGKSREVGPATDVYALGAILYEALTGRPPFKANTPLDTMLLVTSEEPVSPRRLQPRTPHDLETICLKSLAKQPHKRYASAEDLAEDLRSFLAGEPIQARPVGRWERGAKWVRRRPGLSLLLGVSGLAVLALIVALGALWQNAESRAHVIARLGVAETALKERQGQLTLLEDGVKKQQGLLDEKRTAIQQLERASAEERAKTQAAQAITRQAIYIRDMQFAQDALDKEQPQRLLRLLENHQEDVRRFEWHYLWRLCHRERLALRGHQGNIFGVRFAPDGKTLCSVDDLGQFRLWNPVTGEALAVPGGATVPIAAADFSPDGKLLAAGGTDGTVFLWNWPRGDSAGRFTAGTKSITALTFAPDGAAIATGTDGVVRLWNTATRKEQAVFRRHGSGILRVTFSPDGKLMATVSDDHSGKLWETASGKERHTFSGTDGAWVRGLAFSLDGKTLAMAEGHPFIKQKIGAVRLWDLETLHQTAALDVPNGGVFGVAFSPDARVVAVGANSGIIKLWDPAARTVRDTIVAHGDRIHALDFSTEGLTLASAGNSGILKLWDAIPSSAPLALQAHPGDINTVALTPGTKVLFATSRDGMVSVWDLAAANLRASFRAHAGDIFSAALAADGTLLATGGSDGVINLWDPSSRAQLASLDGHAGTIHGLAFSLDRQTLAAATANGTVQLWDVQNRRLRETLKERATKMLAVTFSPDGKSLASAGYDDVENLVTLWDLATRQPLRTFTSNLNSIISLSFSPEGKLLASAHYSGVVKVVDTQTGQEVAHLAGHNDHALKALFSPDGKTLATSSEDGTVKLWDVASWLERFTLKGHGAPVSALAFAGDSRLLVTGAHGGAVKVWDAGPDVPAASRRLAQTASVQEQRARHLQAIEAAEQARQWFSAIWHLDRLIALGPTPAPAGSGLEGTRRSVVHFRRLYTRRAAAHAELAHWKQAADDYTRTVVLLSDDPMDWHLHAWTCLANGDRAGYRRACAAMFARFGYGSNDKATYQVVWTHLLHADAAPDPAVLRLAERLAARHPELCTSFHALGGLLFRSGQYESAIARLHVAMSTKQHGDDGGSLEDWLLLAMAHHRLGHAAEARQWLTRASQRIDALAASAKTVTSPVIRWYQRLGIELLRREADHLINSSSP